MRPIKFRAWDNRKKVMVQPEKLLNLVDGAPRKGQDSPSALFACLYERFDDEQIILMQFTGLLANHGKEIYEGDILRIYSYNEVYDAGAIGDVTFEEGAFRFNWKILLKKNGESTYRTPLSTICSSKGYNGNEREGGFDISGNIYEHPELLKPTRRKSK